MSSWLTCTSSCNAFSHKVHNLANYLSIWRGPIPFLLHWSQYLYSLLVHSHVSIVSPEWYSESFFVLQRLTPLFSVLQFRTLRATLNPTHLLPFSNICFYGCYLAVRNTLLASHSANIALISLIYAGSLVYELIFFPVFLALKRQGYWFAFPRVPGGDGRRMTEEEYIQDFINKYGVLETSTPNDNQPSDSVSLLNLWHRVCSSAALNINPHPIVYRAGSIQ